MRDFLADQLLHLSSALYAASVWTKDAAIRVILFGARREKRR